jgi:subtilisin
LAPPRVTRVTRVTRVLAALAALAVLLPVLPIAAADGPPEPMIVLLRESDGVDTDRVVQRVSRAEGIRATHEFRHALHGFAASLTPGQVRRVARDPEVEAVVPDAVVELAAQATPAGVRRVGAVEAPATRIDGRDGAGERIDADVAVIDTGIDPSHPDLNVVGGYNCATTNRSDWSDKQGHGTHVAGTVGALDNGIGVVGAAPGVRLWSVRVFDANAFSRISWIVCGIDWVTSLRDAGDPDGATIEVVNMSLRDPGTDDGNCGFTNADPEHRAVCSSVAGGTTYVVAAGNDRRVASLWRPASYNEVITVSAIADFDGIPGGRSSAPCTSFGTTDVDDTFADFSNYGGDVDITAPGVCVLSTLRGGGYGRVSGTSMASPLVAGAAAVSKALHPTAAPSTVRYALRAAGSNAWAEGTDRDATHEPLLDMSSFGATPGFELRATPSAGSVWAGFGSFAFDVTAVRGNGFTGEITFDVEGLPAGVSATVGAPLRSWATGPVRVEITADGSAESATTEIELVARSGDQEERRPIDLTVRHDTSPPTATAPRLSFRAPVTMGQTTVPLRLTWSGKDVGSGVAGFEQEEGRNGATPAAVALSPASATSRLLTGSLGGSLVERVRATDRVGNTGAWATAPAIELAGFSEASSLVTRSSGWTSTANSSMWGGRGRYATGAGQWMSFRFSGRAVAWVATKGPGRGAARVYLDGVHVATIDLYASSNRYRQVVFARDVTEGLHTLKVVVYGTSRRPRVDVDGFLVLRRD